MMDYVYAVLIIVAVIVVMLGVQYIKAKGYVKADHIESTVDALSLAEHLVGLLNLKGELKANITTILNTADQVADYVHQLSETTTIEDKAALANEVVELLMNKFGVTIAESEKKLVQIVVDKSLEYLEGKV